nr:serpin family protein [uncultured Oscillibacter sp.]
MKRNLLRLSCLALALLLLTGCGSAGAAPKSLTADLKTHTPGLQPITEAQAGTLTAFSLELLRENWTGNNVLVSPLSVLSALGMTANGAGGETLAQMESVLGLPLEELNETLASWTAALPQEKDCRVDLANSLWLRDDENFTASQDFLQTVTDWYGAEVFPSKFDNGAIQDINGWVEQNTHGMIPEIIREIPDGAVLYLINALALEAEWESIYKETQVHENRVFTTEDGREQPVTLMYSDEGFYLEDDHAQGFLKLYKGGQWAFAALLPEEGLRLEDYAASLTGERLYGILSDAQETLVYAAIPKFQCEYGAELSDSLKALGITDAFDWNTADFAAMGSSPNGPLYISKVLHKTYISVDEKGTKAGAATAVEMDRGGTAPGIVPTVYLDRPFLYLLVDLETGLPAFIGAVTTME